MATKRLYEDTTNGLWIVGDCESVPSGMAFLKVTNSTLISVFAIDSGCLLENVEVTEIESDDTGTSYYGSLADFKAACKTLFQNS